MSDLKNMLTSEQTATILGIPKTTLMQFTCRREIEFIKYGRRNYYEPKEVEKFKAKRMRRRPVLAKK